MLHNLRFLAVVLFSTAFISLKAQDPEFSQFYANPIYTNPAFSGSECGRIALAYRMQYYGLPGGFVTFNASYDQRVKQIGGGFGIMFTHDQAGEGVLTANHVNAAYAYELQTESGVNFRFGIQAGFFQKSLQWDKLRWGDQILAQLGFVNPTQETRIDKGITAANFGAGLLIYSKKFYAGFAAHNITEPNQSFFGSSVPGTELPRRFTVHGGIMIPLEKGSRDDQPSIFSPNILIMAQGKYNQVNVGFYLNKGPLVAGLWFRQTEPNSDALIVLAGFRQGDFKFGYSFDLTVSKLRSAGKTAHELTATYQFCSTYVKRKSYRTLKCPGF
jgi:type IX secretion system PorP/SprF family membrane protein